MDNRMITLLDASGKYSYRVKNNNNYRLTANVNTFLMDPAPLIYDPAIDGYKTQLYFERILPGSEMDFNRIEAVDAENDQAYFYESNVARIQQYGLANQKAGSIFNNQLKLDGRDKPYSVGPFSILNYPPPQNGTVGQGNGLFGIMPLNNQLLMLKYQNSGASVWALMDFTKQWGQLYAPASFDAMGHIMNYGSDMLLNYDSQAMLYMTADNKTVILKTVYK